MTPYWTDPWLTVYAGDCRAVLTEIEPESVHCVVTSPPYWGLRDYGVQGQLGLERTPEEYVASLVAIFREVWRVLKPEGTVWLNLGDCYATGAGKVGEEPGGGAQGDRWKGYRGGHTPENSDLGDKRSGLTAMGPMTQPNRMPLLGLKPKDLVGIPWRVAFALQADGWYLRSDIIWAKPNPMPESVTDRPTKSHEYLFLLSKSARYFYDAEAVAEGLALTSIERLSQPTLAEQHGSDRVPGKTNGPMKAVGRLTGGAYSPPGQSPHANARPTWEDRKAAGAHPGGRGGPDQIVGSGTQRNVHGEGLSHDLGQIGTRNLRSVWTVATQPYAGAHFATFPPKLIEPCIKAGSPEGGVVLDPFAGSGTTGMVAQSLSRRAILIDLNADYLVQAMRRNAQTPLGLGETVA